jgi:hypothetical protein
VDRRIKIKKKDVKKIDLESARFFRTAGDKVERIFYPMQCK